VLAHEDVDVHQIIRGSTLRAKKQSHGQDRRVKGSHGGQQEVSLPPSAGAPEVRQKRIRVGHLHCDAVALAGAEIRALHGVLKQGSVGVPVPTDGRQNPVFNDVPPAVRRKLS